MFAFLSRTIFMIPSLACVGVALILHIDQLNEPEMTIAVITTPLAVNSRFRKDYRNISATHAHFTNSLSPVFTPSTNFIGVLLRRLIAPEIRNRSPIDKDVSLFIKLPRHRNFFPSSQVHVVVGGVKNK